MTWPVVIRSGPDLNQTLSTILFDQFGKPTDQKIFVCKNWLEGFDWASQHQHTQVLFVDSGTLFTDWPSWCRLIDRYPHAGLVAHLIWYPNKRLYLHEQCWFMDVTQFDRQDFLTKLVQHPVATRSEQNLHDDYTPLWVRPTDTMESQYAVTHFGQGLIARQLNRQQGLVNWNNSARQLKSFLYGDPVDLSKFQDYKNIAENQLWVFNNEPITVVKQTSLVSPASGLSWILNIADPATEQIQLVDISRVQIKFAQELWTSWDGSNYGEFVWNFINVNKLRHYELENPNLSPLEKLKLKGRTKFIEYVDTTFNNTVNNKFKSQWQLAQKTKTVNFYNDNLINWVINNDVDRYDHIWCSNILDYKWTLLHTTVEQYIKFQLKIK